MNDSLIKELSFDRPHEGKVNFIVSAKSGFNDSSTFDALNRFFDHEILKANALEIQNKGGRGNALLCDLPYKFMGLLYGPLKNIEQSKLENTVIKNNYGMCLRHYFRGGLIGKFLNDSFWRFDKWACRARLEFELLSELNEQGLPVPRPLICREQVGFFFIKNDIVVEKIDHTSNVAEILQEKGDLLPELRENIANTIAKFALYKVVHSDLNIRNILINEQNQCFVIDFDKCFIKDNFEKSDLMEMLDRLERSFNKEKELQHYEQFDVNQLCKQIKDQALASYEHCTS